LKVITREYPAEWDYATLYPIGDLHMGAETCKEAEFAKYVQTIEKDDRAIVMLLGDLMNNGIKSSVTNVYDEIYTPKEQKRRVIELLKPIKGKIVSAVRGNHELRTDKEVNIDVMEDICHELGIEDAYAGDVAFVKISLGHKKLDSKKQTYTILNVHGAGGGMYIGTGLNKVQNFQYCFEGLDIVISAHTHQPIKSPVARYIFNPYHNTFKTENTCLFVCTSWLGGETYAERKLMRPTAFHPDTIQISGKAKEWR
jgi:predicted phosphodiesterase